MTRSISQQDISWFLDLHDKGQLDLDPPYQRRSVWTLTDKRFFIDTVLNNYPAPPIFLHKAIDDHGHATYHVVDGKQRLQTIIEFAAGKLRVPDDFSNITLQKRRWKELQRETREQFWNYILIVEMLPSVTDAAIRDTFERINRNSRKLQRQEIRHARYDGWFIHFVEAEAEKDEWKSFGVVTAARAKRMADVQFISELFAVNLKSQIIGFDQDWLDELYAEYEDPEAGSAISLDDFRQRIQETKFTIGQCLQVKPQILDYLKIQTHFYSLWGYLTLQGGADFPPADLAPAYLNFMEQVSFEIRAAQDPEPRSQGNHEAEDIIARTYAANSRGASTDLGPRRARHTQLGLAFDRARGATNEGR